MLLVISDMRCTYISKRFYNKEINVIFLDGRYAWIKHFSQLYADTTKCLLYIRLVLLIKFT